MNAYKLSRKTQLDLLRDSMIFIELLCICLNMLPYIFGHVWTLLDTFGHVWTRFVIFGHVWTREPKIFGHALLDFFWTRLDTHPKSIGFHCNILDTRYCNDFGHVWTRKPKNIEKHNKKRNRCPKKAPFLSSCLPGMCHVFSFSIKD